MTRVLSPGRPVPCLGAAVLVASACSNDYTVLDLAPGSTGAAAGGAGPSSGVASTGDATGSGSGGTGGSGGSASAGSSTSSTGAGGSAGSSASSGGGGAGGGGGCGDVASDPDNCGECGHICENDDVTKRYCIAGACTPLCDGDALDCSTPSPPSNDDGCETPRSDTNCGSCGHSCSAVDMVCQLGVENICVCNGQTDCGSGVCRPNGSCKCGAFHCAHGEFCAPSCECNGGQSCENVAAGFKLTCCPAGQQLCVDLETDTAHCGGCGNACPAGFTCNNGTCEP